MRVCWIEGQLKIFDFEGGHWGWKQEPCACWASILPLSCVEEGVLGPLETPLVGGSRTFCSM